MKIHDLLDRDPRGARLANNGQARIDGDDDRGTRVLREELATFVCDGKFGDALRRILDRYLSNLGSARQDAAWVSGFFGSGKSHLLKMAAHPLAQHRVRRRRHRAQFGGCLASR